MQSATTKTMGIPTVGNSTSTTAMSKVFASVINKLRLMSISSPSWSPSPPPSSPLFSSSSSVGCTRLNSHLTTVDRNLTTNAAAGGLLIQQKHQQQKQQQQQERRQKRRQISSYFRRSFGTSTANGGDSDSGQQPNNKNNNKVYWNEEWKRLGLGATLVDDGDGDGDRSSTTRSGTERPKNRLPDNLFFVQLGFGVDQHGDTTNDATKACVRAVRNAIEFNSIPGVIQHIPGGRHGMLIHVKLGVPPPRLSPDGDTKGEEKGESQQQLVPSYVDVAQVAKVFPYGRLLPIEVVVGGINFHSGRVVEELGDKDDVGICCVACVTIGYDNSDDDDDDVDDKKNTNENKMTHRTFNTKDGY